MKAGISVTVLFIYIIGVFCIYCGAYNWFVNGYSDPALYFILSGALPFLIRGLVLLSQAPDEQRKAFWNGFFRWVVLNPLLWFFVSVLSSGSDQFIFIFAASSALMLITPFAQLIWFLVDWIRKRRSPNTAPGDLSEQEKRALNEQVLSKYAQVKAEEYVNALSASLGISKDICSAGDKPTETDESQRTISRLKTELQDCRKTIRELIAKNEKLQSNYNMLISCRAVDELAEAEVTRLTEENARLRSDLEASQNAVDVLHLKISKLQKQLSE